MGFIFVISCLSPYVFLNDFNNTVKLLLQIITIIIIIELYNQLYTLPRNLLNTNDNMYKKIYQ